MGAFFVLAITEAPNIEHRDYWSGRCGDMSAQDWQRLFDEGCPMVPDPSDYDSESEWVDACALMCRAVFDDVFGWTRPEAWPPSDASAVELDGKKYFASGGLSYGDTPTDSYDTIVAFDMIRDRLVRPDGIDHGTGVGVCPECSEFTTDGMYHGVLDDTVCPGCYEANTEAE